MVKPKRSLGPPLILASQSVARRVMLENAGLNFSVVPSGFYEQSMIDEMMAQARSLSDIALALSVGKALDIARQNPDALVIGADQVLEFEGQLLTKALNEDEAREKLRMLKGRSHKLIAAVSVVQSDKVLWQHSDEAVLHMHDFDDEFLEVYCARAGEGLTRAVGAYELEGAGSWLFSAVEGNYFTILGLPLLPLLGYLQEQQGYTP